MPQFINDLIAKLKEKWANLSKSQKTMLITSVSIILLSVILAIYITSKPNFVPLFTGLDPKDSAEIQNVLNEQKIETKIQSGGTTILVRDTDVDKAKMAAALAGYPKNEGMTFEDALKLTSSMTATETDKQRTFTKLKESQIEKALKEMEEYISNAIVNLNIPDSYTFALNENADKASASVKLTLKRQMSTDQIEGIQRFVAASVQGLAPERVVIIDNKGNYLSQDDSSTPEGNASKQLQVKIETKNELEKKIKELLGSYVDSPEDVKVSINLDMNFDTQKINETKYSPVLEDSGIIVSQKTTKEEIVNGSNASGTPGTDTNPTQTTPQYPLANNGQGSTYSKTDQTTNYQNNQKTTEIIKAPGTINYDKSSIAVVLYRYKSYTQSEYEKTAQAKTLPWESFKLQNENNKTSFLASQNDIQNITNLIKNATGISNITVEGYEIPRFIDSEPKQIPYDLIYMIFAFILLMSFAVTMMLKALKSKKTPLTQVELAGAGGPTLIENLTPEEILTKAVEKKDNIEEIDLEDFGSNQYEKQLDKLIKEKPELVAQLLRNWLTEEWE
ncbi:flagellar basal-body MS-ring/collar protein FliF [Caldicellulosiruptoraceae bacterium PP1]